MVDINEVEWGVANSYPSEGVIELHKGLQEFPELRAKIIRHEFEHFSAKSWMGQRKVDALTEISFSELLPFYKKYPKTFFQQHSPITYSKKKNTVYLEWSLILLYSIYLGIGIGLFFFIRFFAGDSTLGWSILKYTVYILVGVFFIYNFGQALRKKINEAAKEAKASKAEVKK